MIEVHILLIKKKYYDICSEEYTASVVFYSNKVHFNYK